MSAYQRIADGVLFSNGGNGRVAVECYTVSSKGRGAKSRACLHARRALAEVTVSLGPSGMPVGQWSGNPRKYMQPLGQQNRAEYRCRRAMGKWATKRNSHGA